MASQQPSEPTSLKQLRRVVSSSKTSSSSVALRQHKSNPKSKPLAAVDTDEDDEKDVSAGGGSDSSIATKSRRGKVTEKGNSRGVVGGSMSREARGLREGRDRSGGGAGRDVDVGELGGLTEDAAGTESEKGDQEEERLGIASSKSRLVRA